MLKVLTSLGSSSCETYLKQSYWLEKSLASHAARRRTWKPPEAHRWSRLRWMASSHWHPPLHRKPCSQQGPRAAPGRDSPCPWLLEARDARAEGKGPLEVKPLLQMILMRFSASAASHVFTPLKTRWARDLPSWKQRAGSLQNLPARWIRQVAHHRGGLPKGVPSCAPPWWEKVTPKSQDQERGERCHSGSFLITARPF